MAQKRIIKIPRNTAKEMILKVIFEEKLEQLNGLNNEELEDLMLALGYGDRGDLPHYGQLIEVIDDKN